MFVCLFCDLKKKKKIFLRFGVFAEQLRGDLSYIRSQTDRPDFLIVEKTDWESLRFATEGRTKVSAHSGTVGAKRCKVYCRQREGP